LVQDEGGTYRYRTGTGPPAAITDKTNELLTDGA
ncbi:MAG: hypothetical protein JWM02_3275, partial [Frankiales bacterium]|nr:hypothetical protein [Frankiales bacterium]